MRASRGSTVSVGEPIVGPELAQVARPARNMTMLCWRPTSGSPTSSSQPPYPRKPAIYPHRIQPRRCTLASSNLRLLLPFNTQTTPICLQTTVRQQSPTRIPTSSLLIPIHLRKSTGLPTGVTGGIAISQPHSGNSTERDCARRDEPSKSTRTTTRIGTLCQAPERQQYRQGWRAATIMTSPSGDRRDHMQMHKTWLGQESMECSNAQLRNPRKRAKAHRMFMCRILSRQM